MATRFFAIYHTTNNKESCGMGRVGVSVMITSQCVLNPGFTYVVLNGSSYWKEKNSERLIELAQYIINSLFCLFYFVHILINIGVFCSPFPEVYSPSPQYYDIHGFPCPPVIQLSRTLPRIFVLTSFALTASSSKQPKTQLYPSAPIPRP